MANDFIVKDAKFNLFLEVWQDLSTITFYSQANSIQEKDLVFRLPDHSSLKLIRSSVTHSSQLEEYPI